LKRAAFVVFGLALVAGLWGGCAQNAVTVPIRSLERSGSAAFVCVRNFNEAPALPVDQCQAVDPVLAANDFSLPHSIAFVTQTTRGEVAVVDVTAGGVVDLDPSVPGFNFVPVGALPTDVVATPGSSAAFVSVSDPNRPGIFAISTSHLFPSQTGNVAPTLASLPACGLPSAPSRMILVRNLAAGPTTGSPRCDGTPSPTVTAPYSLAAETALYGPLKLLVTLPDSGKIAVIDAQDVLARPLGSFDPCPIEATLDLNQDVPITSAASAAAIAGVPAVGADGGAGLQQSSLAEASAPEAGIESMMTDGGLTEGGIPPGSSTGPLCQGRKLSSDPFGTTVHPAAITYADDGRVFVSDDGVSAIHVVNAVDPCHPALQSPLLPISHADPGRAVSGGAIAVSPLTTDFKRFVYAVDVKDGGSVMVFDVSEGSMDRTPLYRPDVAFNQFEPPDRIAFGSAVQSLTFATNEVPLTSTGQVPRAAKCDPVKSIMMSDPGFPYRPLSDLSAGAGPRVLRGTSAYMVLANAQVAVVDLDDFDGACRRPSATDATSLGCAGVVPDSNPAMPSFPAASQEVSCRVVERHRQRSQFYITNLVDAAGHHAPSMQTFPLLHNKDGTVLSVDPSTDGAFTRPRLLGPCLGGNACSCSSDPAKQPPQEDMFRVNVSGGNTTAADFCPTPYPADLTNTKTGQPIASRNWVAFDLVEPRAHNDQTWTVTFEGVLSPWFASRRGRFACAADKPTIDCETGTDPSHLVLLDSDAGFCDQGAQGADLSSAQGIPTGDIVQILDELPDPADPYWASQNRCTHDICEQQYGTAEAPVVVSDEAQITDRHLDANQTWFRRDLLVTKSFQDHLELEPSFTHKDAKGNVDGAPVTCCFPFPPTYALRGGSQWVVNGSVAGFEHHNIPDPNAVDSSTAACTVSCDPTLVLRNGRVPRRGPTAATPNTGDPTVFRNQALQFVAWDPAVQCSNDQRPCLQRDMGFSFQEVGGFSPLSVSLSTTTLVLPQQVTFVPGLAQLAIPDATSQGLMLFDLRRITTARTIF
jgi:hypothetical protein